MTRFLTLGVLAGLLVGMPAVSLADAQGPEDAQGEEMVVAQAGTLVMRGSSELAALPAGHRFQLIRREGPWMGTRTTVDGQTVSGWVWEGNVTTPQEFAEQPPTDAQGEEMVVARAAPMMQGSSTLATLPAGHRFQVIGREGPWVETQTTVDGQTVRGWLWERNVTTLQQPVQQLAQRPAAPRYSSRPGASTQRYNYRQPLPNMNRSLIIGGTQYGRNYWRADRLIKGF